MEKPQMKIKNYDTTTDNPSLVTGMKRYFDLIWEHDSEGL